MSKLYRQITLTDDQEDKFVFTHLMAMTGEKLHSKSEIAYELGARDNLIAELEKELSHAQTMGNREQSIRDLEQQAKALNDYADSILKRDRLFHINLSERMTIHDSCRNQAEDYLNQAKALKEQVK